MLHLLYLINVQYSIRIFKTIAVKIMDSHIVQMDSVDTGMKEEHMMYVAYFENKENYDA